MNKRKKTGFFTRECALRELHLIDIENELGTARPLRADIERFREFYIKRNNVPKNAHIVIGASSGATMVEAAVAWPNVRTEWTAGPDGADRALISVALEENVDKRFGRVIIASGDHIFADAASKLLALGLQVTVFSRATSLSNKLRDVCRDIRVFSSRDFALAA
jgi:hypothetical protein